MMAVVARHLRITGHVQGVAYRAWTRGRAHQLGVAGWVRNEEVGSVEAHLEGPEEAVEQLVTECWSGPGPAEVRDVQSTKVDPEGLTGFEIRR